ncbi:MAG: alpha/beta hydrolase [Microbacteriaceae bacterium]|nr:alpha/beta hydrolase [Microbacteriaceae bacterium]
MNAPYPYAGLMSPRIGVECTAEVDGTTTHWWEYSAKPKATTIVMIHGFRGDHHGLQLIGDALHEFRILIPDIPVFGSSSGWPDGSVSIDGYGRWLRAFLTATSTQTAIVIGHSFGSLIVANAMRGDRTLPVVLINPISQRALSGPKRFTTAIASAWYGVGGLLPETWGSAWLGNPLFVRLMSALLAKSRNPGLRAWIHEQHARYFSLYSDRNSLIGAFAASTSASIPDFASEIGAPVLLVAADHDDITPLAAQIAVQRQFPNAALHVLSDVGHLVHYERPLETASAIREFLARQSDG